MPVVFCGGCSPVSPTLLYTEDVLANLILTLELRSLQQGSRSSDKFIDRKVTLLHQVMVGLDGFLEFHESFWTSKVELFGLFYVLVVLFERCLEVFGAIVLVIENSLFVELLIDLAQLATVDQVKVLARKVYIVHLLFQ